MALYLIAAIALLLAAYLIFRFQVRRDYLRLGRVTWFSLILELLLCGLYYNFPYLYLPVDWPELPPLPQNTVQFMVGFFLVGIGLPVILLGMARLGLRGMLGLAANGLVQSNLYRISRNPQIVGGFLLVAGIACLWPSWYALGWVCLYIPFFHMMVLTEEEHLRKVFGTAYIQYCQSVPRYLGIRHGWNRSSQL